MYTKKDSQLLLLLPKGKSIKQAVDEGGDGVVGAGQGDTGRVASLWQGQEVRKCMVLYQLHVVSEFLISTWESKDAK